MKHLIIFLKNFLKVIFTLFNQRKYFVDRTYNLSIGTGSINIAKRHDAGKEYLIIQDSESSDEEKTKVTSTKRSIQKALISFRWTTHKGWKNYGGEIVLTRQPDVTAETLILAEDFKDKMQRDLFKNGRFMNKKESFISWANDWCKELEKHGFYNIKEKS